MAFGQQSGPPASPRQLRELTELLVAAGHRDFRDARGPLGLTQRQAAGRFSRDEADALVERLRGEEAGRDGPAGEEPPPAPEPSLRWVPAERLAGELRRRGWTVVGPRAPDDGGDPARVTGGMRPPERP
ncbi:MAG TPA: hypothetical protein VMV02_08915 [Acidimicrobiales bacterium]|nr:hypothetical protein [Acidimicrobiales bacterium]